MVRLPFLTRVRIEGRHISTQAVASEANSVRQLVRDIGHSHKKLEEAKFSRRDKWKKGPNGWEARADKMPSFYPPPLESFDDM